jgi:site-specific recombinase XerD
MTPVRTVKDGNPAQVTKAKFGLHALRHAAAALCIEQGMSPKRMQMIMGHSSILYGYCSVAMTRTARLWRRSRLDC